MTFFVLVVFGSLGCHESKPAQGPMERAGKSVDRAAVKTGAALEKAASTTGRALGKAAKETGSAFDRLGQKLDSGGTGNTPAK